MITVELLQAVESGGSFEGIAGVLYRRDGGVVCNPRRAYLEDLDALAFPHRTAWAVPSCGDCTTHSTRAAAKISWIRSA